MSTGSDGREGTSEAVGVYLAVYAAFDRASRELDEAKANTYDERLQRVNELGEAEVQAWKAMTAEEQAEARRGVDALRREGRCR